MSGPDDNADVAVVQAGSISSCSSSGCVDRVGSGRSILGAAAAAVKRGKGREEVMRTEKGQQAQQGAAGKICMDSTSSDGNSTASTQARSSKEAVRSGSGSVCLEALNGSDAYGQALTARKVWLLMSDLK